MKHHTEPTKIKLDWLKLQPFRIKMNLVEVHKVTEYRDDCVYRTRSLGYIICRRDYQLRSKDAIIGPVSTSITRQL